MVGHDRLPTKVGLYAAYGLILVFFVAPVLWLVSLSIRTPAEVFMTDVRLIPENPTIENYHIILESSQFLYYLWNGTKFAVFGAIGAAILAAPAAYAFSRFDFTGRKPLFFAVFAFQMISPLVIMVPLYRYMSSLGLVESTFGAALVYMAIASPLAVWVLKGFFDGFPREIEEAAMIDGCSRIGAFVRIVLPLSRPGLMAALILTTIAGWSQFIVPFVLLSKPRLLPISVGIYNYLGDHAETSIQIVAAGTVVSILPATIMFLIFQRFIVRSLTAGALKE